MRLHRLTMTAFGPFREEQVVDFDALSDAGLFLLTGRTGAGKTSLLDAVTYALYGQVPGMRASSLRVRSDHAEPTTPTVVQLELTVRGARLRIRRTPDWLRPRKRGEGTTRERGSVLLERSRDGDWEFVSSRHDEVGDELGQLLGMTCDQFCQVVLLPQGDFASFLRADAESRKRLLERLFGTERFSAVEAWLGALKVTRGEAYEQELHRRRDLVGRLAEVTDEIDPPDNDAGDAAVLSWADSVLADVGRLRAVAQAAVERASADRVAADAALVAAREVDARQRRLRSLREREGRILAAAEQRRAHQAELEAARRASALAPLLESVDEAVEALAAATSALGAGRVRVSDLGVSATGSADVLRGRELELRAGLTRLEDLLADAARLVEIDGELTVTQRRLTARRSSEAAHAAALAAGPSARERLAGGLRDAEQAAAQLPGLEAELLAARGRAAGARVRDALGQRREEATEGRSGAVAQVQSARERVLDLRERRLNGMAAELAAALVPGQPCPVCGGVEHRVRAGGADASAAASASVSLLRAPLGDAAQGRVGEEEERRAAAALAVAEVELESADATARQLADDHAAARITAGGDDPLAALMVTAQELERRLQQLSRLAGSKPAVDLELSDLDADLAAHLAAQRTDQAAVHADEAGQAVLRAERHDLESRLTAARGSDADVPSRVTRLSAAADALGATAAALADEAHAKRALSSAERRLERAASAAGFAAVDEAAVAIRPSSRIDALAERIAAHDREEHLVAAGLAEPELQGLALRDVPSVSAELAQADDAALAAASALQAAHGESGRLDAAHRKALQLHGEVVGAVSRLGPLRAAFEDADAIAKLATGTGTDNRLRMRLSYYVLSARLEQVSAAASERLLRMSDGRFALRHTDERAGGNQRSGLGLLVCDSWYGTTRDPSTLSGGESFMASLALALGLADVVVAEAGGQLMDTLFVDEGFGTLDDQTLDAVLDVLDGLRAGGRAVGLVSHVSELRDRIPAQLFVHKAHHGSTLQLSA